MPARLPDRPSLEHLRKEAKHLLRELRRRDPTRRLADAQHELARHYGFATWTALKAHVAERAAPTDPLAALVAAFHAGDAAAVRRLLAAHPPLRARLDTTVGAFGATPLIVAAGRGDVAMIDTLLDAGASPDARSDWWAGGFGVLDLCPPAIAPTLLARGATLDANAAARLGMHDALAGLLDADPTRVHARGGDGQTPLHVASTVAIARLLVERGADVDALDVDHESTPAQYRVREHPDVARFLVDRGARADLLLHVALGRLDDVRARLDADPALVATAVTDEWFPMRDPRAGGTIYHWTLERHASAHRVAQIFGRDDVLALLFERSPAPVALAAACEVGDSARAAAVHAAEPDVATRLTERERRRLPFAAQGGDRAAVARLLHAGWPVDARGQHGATALHWAAWIGDAAMVRLLLAHGAPIDVREPSFDGTPLSWAVHASVHGWHPDRGDYGEIARLLLDALRAAGAPMPPAPDSARADVLAAYVD